jgi:predicted nucleic acid-binding protein
MLYPVWVAAQANRLTLNSSKLLLLETLVKPLRGGDSVLVDSFRRLLDSPQVHLEPVSRHVLERAAQLRAQISIKTPDAIHAATCLLLECDYLLTNDPAFTRVPGITTILLRDFLAKADS